jgi:hypothetical protein
MGTVRFLLLLRLLSDGSTDDDPALEKARLIIRQAITAKGGKERLERLQAWHIRYEERFFGDGKESKETGDAFEHLAKGRARYEVAPDHVTVVNGDRGWIKKGDKVDAMPAGQLAGFQEYLKGKEAILTLLPLLTDEWQLASVGEKDIDGSPADAIHVMRKGGWTATTYWDKKTHLLVKAEYAHKRLDEPDEAKRKATIRVSVFKDHRPYAGLLFHTKVEAFSGGRRTGEVVFSAVEISERLSDALFGEPKARPK